MSSYKDSLSQLESMLDEEQQKRAAKRVSEDDEDTGNTERPKRSTSIRIARRQTSMDDVNPVTKSPNQALFSKSMPNKGAKITGWSPTKHDMSFNAFGSNELFAKQEVQRPPKRTSSSSSSSSRNTNSGGSTLTFEKQSVQSVTAGKKRSQEKSEKKGSELSSKKGEGNSGSKGENSNSGSGSGLATSNKSNNKANAGTGDKGKAKSNAKGGDDDELDADGIHVSIPTHDEDGKPLSKKHRKKLDKARRKALMEQDPEFQARMAAAKQHKKLSKAERRAKQERERAQKQQEQGGKGGKGGNNAGNSAGGASLSNAGANKGKGKKVEETEQVSPSAAGSSSSSGNSKKGGKTASLLMQFDDQRRLAKHQKKQIAQLSLSQKPVPLFSHLPQFESPESLTTEIKFSSKEQVHPAVLHLGLKYADMQIRGSNARCVAMLNVFKQLVSDYNTPSGKELSRDLWDVFKPNIQFLEDCRPKSISMGNAIKRIKLLISEIPGSMNDFEAKNIILSHIDTFLQQRIFRADELIAANGVSKIRDGDVLMVYACSRVVELILKRAKDENKRFRVVLVDSNPLREGKEMLGRLVKYDIECTYVMLNAVSYMMREVTKVFVGAYALLSNGNTLSRAGTALVAMMAKSFNVPVIVCCESYKFTERVQLDSITFNELGDPEEMVEGMEDSPVQDWRDVDSLKLLNLRYDLTPSEFVSMVITEAGMLPVTSVPVIVREYLKELTIV